MILHLSHNDLDGITSLLLSKEIGIKYIFPCSYTQKSKYNIIKIFKEFMNKKDFIKNINSILFTDINMTETMYTEIKNNLPNHIPDKKVFVIDHHRASDEVDINFVKNIDTEYCASKQYYNKLKQKSNVDLSKYEDLINAVDGFDSWQFDRSPFSLDLQRTFYYFIFNRECYDKHYKKLFDYMDLLREDTPTNSYKPKWYNRFLEKYYKYNKEKVDKIVKNNYNINGIVYVPFLDEYEDVPAYEVEVQLMKKDPEIKHFIFIFNDHDDFITFSLRTNNEEKHINIGKLVMEYGGGGNECAGSFVMEKDHEKIKDRIKEIIKKLSGEPIC